MKSVFPLFIAFLSFLIASCSEANSEKSIFSIPENASAVQLEQQGFRILRNTYEVRGVPRADLDLGYARVYIKYCDSDTNKMESHIIYTDKKPFQKLTGLKPRNYASIEIEGVNYKVTVDSTQSVLVRRLGLSCKN